MISSTLDVLQHKIYSKEEDFKHTLNVWRFKDQKLVFTNGCFDLMHLGHIDYLAKAADLGNRLIVGLNTDASASNLKGPSRPITDQHSRSAILAALFFVDAVIFFDEATPLKLIQYVIPDVLVKGADYSVDQIVGADIVLAKGGEVKTIELLPGYSTTSIENKIKSQ